MDILKIDATDDIPRWFDLLEKRGLIRRLKPTRKITHSRRGEGCVDVVYSSSLRYGPHKLICVKPDSPFPVPNYHPDNEEFILLDTRRGVRPLYMLIGLRGQAVLRRKAAQGKLSGADFVLLKMAFNRPGTCVFTMCRDTVHCEVVFPGKGEAPVFFVTEPRDLPLKKVCFPGYAFSLGRGGRKR